MKPYVTHETLDAKCDEWLARVAPYNTHDLTLNARQSALLVVDMQDFFLDPASPTFTCGGPPIIPNLQKLIAAFRAAERPVIYTKHVHSPDLSDAGIMGWWWEGMCLEGSPESRIHADLAPLAADKIVPKHRYSAFYNTDLETVLRCQQIEDVVISGIMTNMCCESTARDAYYRDYRVFIPADGTGSVSEELHLASLMNLAFGFAHIGNVQALIAGVESKHKEPSAALRGSPAAPRS
jgi:nicotinamidase-related amidase